MAYKVVLSKRFSKKLIRLFVYHEKNFSLELTKKLVEKVDQKIILLSRRPEIGLLSAKIPGVYKISFSRANKLYYKIQGRKIIMLNLLTTAIASTVNPD